MFYYESVVKNVIPLFFAVISFSMIFYYFILTYKELTHQQL